jgi:uncharacterized spore protein YtfJ
MSDEEAPSAAGAAEEPANAPLAAYGFERLADVGADRVFLDPVVAGDRTIITASAIEIAGGGGFGGGSDSSREQGGSGYGGGWGGRSEGRPVAVIDIGPDGVYVRPIIDFTRIGITIALASLAVWRTVRRSR